MKTMSSGISVFFIQKDDALRRIVGEDHALGRAPSERRNIRPCSCCSRVAATSTVKRWSPLAERIVSGTCASPVCAPARLHRAGAFCAGRLRAARGERDEQRSAQSGDSPTPRSSTAVRPLRARRDPRLQLLARLKLAEMRVAHRLHVDEHVLAAQLVGPLDEAIAANAVEPFDLHRLELAGRVGKRLAIGPFGRRHGRARLLRQGRARGRSTGSVLACSPRSSRTGTHSIDRAFGDASAAMLAKHAEMEQHVAVDLVADQEAEAARRVEPFHAAGDRRQLGLRRSRSSDSISA